MNQSRLSNQNSDLFKSWVKHFLICFEGFTVRVHFLLFGTYRINETRDLPVRLNLTFKNGELNLYSCSIKILEGNLNIHYNWSEDVMNENWNPRNANTKLKEVPNKMAYDTLLEQHIFSGVGNIIKNKTLYRLLSIRNPLLEKSLKLNLMKLLKKSVLILLNYGNCRVKFLD